MIFNELGLKEALLSAVRGLGFEKPTEIQEQVIPYLIKNQGDLVGLASTGTGKTAAFGLPLLNLLDLDTKITQGLIICPTRELCIQISKDLISYTKNLAKVKVVAVYGGADISKQIRQLDKGAHIIVATPGRLKDLISRRKVQIRNIDVVVLDEADEMLNMGFKEDIDHILEGTPKHKSVWLFSATMPKDVARIASNYMDSPFEVTVGAKNEANKNIHHQYCVVKERDRFSALRAIIDFNPQIYGLIFCRTRRETGMVADKLMAAGYNAEPLHGDLSQAQRDRVMGKFRTKTLQILVATDVAARGIDVDDITHVIHHKLPEDAENYTHRSGRTARAGRKGVSLALINTKEGKRIKAIEKTIGDKFELINIPTSSEIGERQLLNSVNKLREVSVDEKVIGKHMPAIMKGLEDFSKEDLVKRFLSAEINRFSSSDKNDQNLNAKLDTKGRDDYKRKTRLVNSDSQRFFVNLGQKDGFNRGALLRIVCDKSGLTKNSIGKIDILKNFSFFDADISVADKLLRSLQNVEFEGKSMSVEKTNNGNSGSGTSSNAHTNRGSQKRYQHKKKPKKMTSKERKRRR